MVDCNINDLLYFMVWCNSSYVLCLISIGQYDIENLMYKHSYVLQYVIKGSWEYNIHE